MGNGTPTMGMGPSLTSSSSSNAGGVDSPKRKSSKRPRVDSGMDDRPEKEEKEVMDDVEMKEPTSALKATDEAGDTKVEVEKVREDKSGEPSDGC